VRPKLLIFDLDGTLIDSRKDIAIAANWTRKKLGFSPQDPEFIANQIGGGVRNLLKRILPELHDGQIKEGMDMFRGYYLEHCLNHTELYKGTHEMLATLSKLKLAVVTNKPTDMSEKILAGLRVRKYFADVRGGDDVVKKKPDPVMLLEVLTDLHLLPDDAIMIGDSPVDVEAARRAKMRVCGVTYGGIGDPDHLIAAKPDFLAHSPAEVTELFGKIPK